MKQKDRIEKIVNDKLKMTQLKQEIELLALTITKEPPTPKSKE